MGHQGYVLDSLPEAIRILDFSQKTPVGFIKEFGRSFLINESAMEEHGQVRCHNHYCRYRNFIRTAHLELILHGFGLIWNNFGSYGT